MVIILSTLIASRGLQFIGLFSLTFIYLVSFPYTGSESFFDIQAIFDFTFLGIPRALDITNKLINGTINLSSESNFPLKLKFTTEPVNMVHEYNYSGWTWDYKDRPRPNFKSMVGPYLASYLSLPWSFYQRTFDKLFLQSMTRLSVAILTLTGFAFYCSAVTRKYGYYTTSVLIILTMSQFYFLFNLSRLLPNCLSLFMVLITTAAWLSRRNMTFIVLSATTIAAFHSVTFFLFLPMALHSMVIQKTLTFGKLLFYGLGLGYLAFGASSLFDSYMWGEYVWPQSKLFKDLVSKSTTDLGLSTLTWYLFIALPQYLLSSIIFVPFASRRCIKSAFAVSLTYLSLCSLFGYKDVDLVIYCYPLLNTCAANTIAISFYRFFTLRSHPESWLIYLIRRKLGYQVTPKDEFEAQEKQMDDQEESKRKQRKLYLHISPPRNDSARLHASVEPTHWLTSDSPPPPYTSQSPPVIPEEIPLTFNANHSTRGRQPPQSSPTSFLRRRGGLRKSHTNQHNTMANREGTTSDDRSTVRPRRIPIEVDSMIHSKASHYGSMLALIVTFHFCVNAMTIFYLISTTYYRYPGGEAVAWLNEHIKHTELTIVNPQDIGVYVGKRTIETGFTRFLQINGIIYDNSDEIYTMATKSQRTYKYRNQLKSTKLSQQLGTKSYSQNFDFKVIYFIVDHIDQTFLDLQCHKQTNYPLMESKTNPGPPFKTISWPEKVTKTCVISHEFTDCPLIKVINSYGGLELSRAHMSIHIAEVPTLWIFKCLIVN